MKAIAYIANGAKLKQLPTRFSTPTPRAEGEIIKEKELNGNILTVIVRWRDGDGWQWRATETNGTGLWYYKIVPDADGNALKSGALDSFEACPGYEYMVESLIPLAPDSPDRLCRPEGERAEDIARWRAKYLAAAEAASALGRVGGSSTSEAKKAAARANGAKGGRPRSAERIRADLGLIVISILGAHAEDENYNHLAHYYDRMIDPRATRAVREDAYAMSVRGIAKEDAEKIRHELDALNLAMDEQ